MQQLVRYITLLKCNNTFDVLNILQDMEHNNRVFQYNPDIDTIFLDGDWWSDFITSHTLDIYETMVLHLRTRFKANHLHLIYRNVPIACFTWDDDVKMYLGKNGGYYKGE